MKTAVITGASSGIGLAIASQLLQDKWKVYCLSRTKPDLSSDSFVWVECDLGEPGSISRATEAIAEAAIDLVVSNAGVAFKELATNATQKTYDAMFSVNVLAPILLVSGLKEKITHATILSVSSVSDRLIEKDFALYCSSKAANTRYFEALADELDQAKVFSLLPDYVDTPMLRKQEAPDFDWLSAIDVNDLAKFAVDLGQGKVDVETGTNIIIVTDALKEDLQSREKLYGYNTDTLELTRL